MSFVFPKEKHSGKVMEVTIGATAEQGGTRSHTVNIGGSTSLPFHLFEGNHPNPPVVAMEVFDKIPPKFPEPLKEIFQNVIDKPGEMAKICVEKYGADEIRELLDRKERG